MAPSNPDPNASVPIPPAVVAPPSTAPPGDPPLDGPIELFHAAYEKFRPKFLLLQGKEIKPVNVDFGFAYGVVRASAPKIQELRPQLVQLPGFEIWFVDDLEDIALTANYTNSLNRLATQAPTPVNQLVGECTSFRDRAVYDLQGLANRGIISGSKLDEVRGQKSFRDIGHAAVALVMFCRKNAALIIGKCAITHAELNEIEQKASELLDHIADKEHNTTSVDETAREKQLAFSLMVLAYSWARRGVSYLRWFEEDADKIAPSIYGGRTGNNRRGPIPEPEPAPAPAPATGASPAPQPAPGNANGGAGNSGNGSSGGTPPVGPGFPGDPGFHP